MISSSLKTTKKQYIKDSRFDNLYVIPYIRGRLVFAELAARAIEGDGFEQVIVDLPFFLNRGGLWEEAVKLFPYVSCLYCRKEDGGLAAIPFTPSDAVCSALSAGQILREWGSDIEVRFIDDSRVIHYPQGSMSFPDVRVGDDYTVFTQGLHEYYNCPYDQLDRAWREVSKDQRFFNEYRAGLVSDRLKSYLKSGRKTLFVCEYRLWWLVKKMLQGDMGAPAQYYSQPWKDVKAVLVADDPVRLWLKGALDDCPAVVYEFYNSLRQSITASFDKLTVTEKIVNRSLQPDRDHGVEGASLRRSIVFYQYLRSRLLCENRLTPMVYQHFFDTAYACLGKTLAGHMTKKLFFYPQSRGMRKYLSISEGGSSPFVDIDNVRSLAEKLSSMNEDDDLSMDTLYDGYREPVEGLEAIARLFPRLNKRLLRSLGGADIITWSVKADYYQYELAASKLRGILTGKDEKLRIRKSSGSLQNGIHWKATINSMAIGEDDIYVKHRYRHRQSRKKFDEFTPVTFIFTEDFRGHGYRHIHSSNRSQRHLDLNPLVSLPRGYQPPDQIINTLYSYYKVKDIMGGHIVKRAVSSITLLYNKGVVDDARYDAINSRFGQHKACRSAIGDPELMNFLMPEKGIAWSVKYADHTVIVAAKAGWKPSQMLADFARKRNIRIAHVPLSVFQKDFIERLKTLHFTSSAIKRLPERDEIVERFIE
jgi:hypothetical protein